MTGPTHVTFAQLVYLLAVTMMGVGLSGLNALLVALGALLPDMDTETSLVGRMVPPLSRWIERRFGHRTLTHSWLFIAALALLLLPLVAIDGELYVSFLAGYASHPLLDSMTVTGVQLFYPLSSVRCVFPLEVKHPHRYRVQTGSRADQMLGLGFLLACVPSFLVAEQGHEHLIRSAQRSITSAVREYNQLSPSVQVYAELKARNMTTGEELSGTFPVVGALNDRTLLIQDSTVKLRTVGVGHDAEYVTRDILCRKGATVRTTARQIDMTDRPLGEIGQHVLPGSDHRLFGELRTDEKLFLPESSRWFSPVTASSGKITLKFATVEDIGRADLNNIFVTGGVVTLRTTVPVDSNLTGAEGGASASDARSFFRLTFTGKRIEILRAEGDTVREGQRLAREIASESEAEDILLVQKRIALLAQERGTKMADLEARLNKALLQMERDSLEAADAQRLVQEGFLPASALGTAQARVAQAGLHFLKVQRDIDAAEADLDLRRNRLFKRLDQLTAPRGELCSSVGGVVNRVTRTTKGGKEHVTFTLRRP